MQLLRTPLLTALFIPLLISCNNSKAPDSKESGATPQNDSAAIKVSLCQDAMAKKIASSQSTDYDSKKEEAKIITACGDGQVVRKGKKLSIQAGGKTVSFTDNDKEGEDAASYLFEGAYPEKGLFLIYNIGWEWGSNILVDKRNGQKYDILSLPDFSPGSTRFVTTSSGENIEGSDINMVQVWKLNGEKWEKEFETTTLDWGPAGAAWKSDTEFVMEAEQLNEATDEIQKLSPKSFVLSGGKWSFK